MDTNQYQQEVIRTAGSHDIAQQFCMAGLGISGEAGEIADIIKKVLFHDHELDPDKLILEMGDLLWYVTFLAEILGTSLDEIMERNVSKLRRRYPSGFSSEDSKRRADEQ